MSSTSPTMQDVARQAGVGIATVDRVLNRRATVRKPTEERVLQAARALGFSLSGFKIADETPLPMPPPATWRLGMVLLCEASPFYQEMARALHHAAQSSTRGVVQMEIGYLEQKTPQEAIALLHDLSTRCAALALVTLDHPAINQAIDALSASGIPIYSLLTDVTAGSRAGHLGIDNRKAGRTAAWAIDRLSPGSQVASEVGILIGDHRFLCQELSEISFRSYFRERRPDVRVLETRLTRESVERASDVTRRLLAEHPCLRGLYVSGGGVEGVLQALRDSGRQEEIVVVCTDLTETTRAALVEGVVDVILAHPCYALARATLDAMLRRLDGDAAQGSEQHLLPFDIITVENV